MRCTHCFCVVILLFVACACFFEAATVVENETTFPFGVFLVLPGILFCTIAASCITPPDKVEPEEEEIV